MGTTLMVALAVGLVDTMAMRLEMRMTQARDDVMARYGREILVTRAMKPTTRRDTVHG
jgi:hypothetical protein